MTTTTTTTTTTKINTNDFRSELEHFMAPERREGYAAERRREGAAMATTHTMHVAGNGVWSASYREGNISGCVESFEKISYHAFAEQVLQGFLAAGGKCIFHGYRGIYGEVSL